MAIKETKRGTTPMLAINLVGLDKEVAKVEFVFKQKMKDTAEALVTKVYEGGVNDTVVVEDGVYYLNFTDAESRQFKADSTYYMDTRVIYTDGSIPQTDILKFYSLTTLFEEVSGNG